MPDRPLPAPYDGDCIVCEKPYVYKDKMWYKRGRLCHWDCRDRDDVENNEAARRCPDCEAEILWVHVQGRMMPLDVVPGGEGARYRKDRVDEGGRKIVAYLSDEELAENTRPVYCSHASTCAKAAS